MDTVVTSKSPHVYSWSSYAILKVEAYDGLWLGHSLFCLKFSTLIWDSKIESKNMQCKKNAVPETDLQALGSCREQRAASPKPACISWESRKRIRRSMVSMSKKDARLYTPSCLLEACFHLWVASIDWRTRYVHWCLFMHKGRAAQCLSYYVIVKSIYIFI